jgi:hypothetical protein
MAQQQWWFHWDYAPVYLVWMAAKHLPYSPDPAQADFFPVQESGGGLGGHHLGPG